MASDDELGAGMNRKIKFRAWDKEKRELIPWDKLIWNSQGLLNALHNAGTPEHYGNWIAQQFTGLKDKNGVEIYEGDVFMFDPTEMDSILVVAYKNAMSGRGEVVAQYAFELFGSSHWNGEGGQDCFGSYQHLQDIHLDEFDISGMEVIGNIYEHPHLLEGRDA